MSQNGFLGQEVTVNGDDGTVVHNASFGGGGSSRFGGGGSTTPPATLVATGSNLEFNLIWDSSVANLGSNETAFMNAVINVAKYYESLYSTSKLTEINIHVGWGEVAGSSLPSGALGASESNGYLTNYATVLSHLPGYTDTHQLSGSTQFFISSAEAKAFGLVNGISGTDGYIGFGKGVSWDWNSATTTIQPAQYDFTAVAAHEISEVMGRIEMEGHTSFNGHPTYTILDLFNYSSPGHLVLSSGDNSGTQVSSYFSIDGGATPEGYFNDGYKGGDIADWASYNGTSTGYTLSGTGLSGVQDAYDAFGYNGIAGAISLDDLAVDQVVLLGTVPSFDV